MGHTHEDIDAQFSCFAKRLQQHEAITLQDMLKLLGAQRITTIFNFREWLNPHLNIIQGHSEAHHYRFLRQGEKVSIRNWIIFKDITN